MKKHEHSGCAGRSFENPHEVLTSAGLKNGNFVLADIGTGTGYLSIAAAEIMGSVSKVYALDSHEESIKVLAKELAEKGISNISAIKADAVNGIPLQRDTVDICLMSNVVHGFAANGEMDKVIKNIDAILKDEGKIMIIDFKKVETPAGPPLEIRLNPDEVENIVESYGYVLVRNFNAGQDHYGLVFNKACLQDKVC
jgi:ubiquinone/menaquinone biosynthesis C-methylase UbiE